jgi:hypothetical protein
MQYQAYGYIVSSDLALPALPEAEGTADVHVRLERAPDHLSNERGRGACYSAAPGEALVSIDGIGRFHITNGSEIVVDVAPEADRATLPLFVLNLAFGLLLMQRGDLVLHAAAIETDGKCVALAGTSSAGKSSVAAALHARGYRVLTDELCVIRDQPGRGPCVVPGPPHLQVWADALDRLGHDPSALEPVRPGLRKYALPLGAGHATVGLPLEALYVLQPWGGDDVEITPLTGVPRFEALAKVTYRFEYVQPMALTAVHFDRIRRLLSVSTALLKHPQRWRSMGTMIERLALPAPPGGSRSRS